MFKTFLPVILKPKKQPKVLGTQIEGKIVPEQVAPRAWIHKAIKWFECELSEGNIVWTQKLLDIYEFLQDRDVVWGTRGCAEYAREIPEYPNSPPKVEYYAKYANLVIKAIEDFNLKYVEVWNEPDTDPHYMSSEARPYYGGWGTWDNPYQGGVYYGEFLSIIYPIIKSAYPDVTIIAGALACHEYTEPFLEGFAQFEYDAISFHAYPYWKQSLDTMKQHVSMIRQYTDCPLYCTETSLIKYDSITNPEFENDQADYWDYVIQKGYELELTGLFWYSMDSEWKCTNLVSHSRKKPAWERYWNSLSWK